MLSLRSAWICDAVVSTGVKSEEGVGDRSINLIAISWFSLLSTVIGAAKFRWYIGVLWMAICIGGDGRTAVAALAMLLRVAAYVMVIILCLTDTMVVRVYLDMVVLWLMLSFALCY